MAEAREEAEASEAQEEAEALAVPEEAEALAEVPEEAEALEVQDPAEALEVQDPADPDPDIVRDPAIMADRDGEAAVFPQWSPGYLLDFLPAFS